MTILPDNFHPMIKEIAKQTNKSELQLANLCRHSMELCKKEGKSKRLAAQETWNLLLCESKSEPECVEVWQ